jgi:hypothetical protein
MPPFNAPTAPTDDAGIPRSPHRERDGNTIAHPLLCPQRILLRAYGVLSTQRAGYQGGILAFRHHSCPQHVCGHITTLLARRRHWRSLTDRDRAGSLEASPHSAHTDHGREHAVCSHHTYGANRDSARPPVSPRNRALIP